MDHYIFKNHGLFKRLILIIYFIGKKINYINLKIQANMKDHFTL